MFVSAEAHHSSSSSLMPGVVHEKAFALARVVLGVRHHGVFASHSLFFSRRVLVEASHVLFSLLAHHESSIFGNRSQLVVSHGCLAKLAL
jgi:hypothetical protein